ncbi:MAG: CRISPR-associated ring nuclease Crn3/Csx3 [Oscillatoria sp. PMC 1051.18]|nr:CRISPR-associated ring nuclease Crn3/Csx3 [Oscillatoria sp. PMC 1050.18]MEC5029861.1 CRISPR-associated ring nuclease Crn3/Csx3 [Oscillatoria sp. PMC 1051.18]
MNNPALKLNLSEPQIWENLSYQVLTIELTAPDRIIDPEDINNLELPTNINFRGGIVISGRAPIWLYSYLTHECHPTSWIACYDPRLGAVVTATHSRDLKVGQVIPITVSNGRQHSTEDLCPALLIVGPPNSGKSVLSHALFQALLLRTPNIYLQRAHWDGEGNYVLELGEDATEEEIERFKAANKGQLSSRFFPYHAQAILELRRQKALVIVDVGGMVQPEKLPLLEACSHYLIISSQAEEIEKWHEFCHDRGNLFPIAEIFSVLTDVKMVTQEKPYLKMTAGPWICGETKTLPKELLERVSGLLVGS